MLAPCLFINGKKFNLRETKLSEIWGQKDTQDVYKLYEACKLCKLGCVTEAAWSTYDLGFVINESFRDMILPLRKQIDERNHGKIRVSKCISQTAAPISQKAQL